MSFTFSKASLGNLQGVHPDLIKVMAHALELSPVDFAVICGLRSVSAQKAAVAAGKSKTMTSRHLTGHAVDIEAFVEDQYTWSDPYYIQIAGSVRSASLELGIPIVWGGTWDRVLGHLSTNLSSEVMDYKLRQKMLHGHDPAFKVLADLDHFELARSSYP